MLHCSIQKPSLVTCSIEWFAFATLGGWMKEDNAL